MIELRRILLVDWYLFRVEQIDIGGMTAFIGPNGSGKSAIIDAAQTVLTGANMTSIRFNASAQSAYKSERSIRDYCLGVVSLDEKGERSEPTRGDAYTYAILGFEDLEGEKTINLGVAFSASATRGSEVCEARFLVRGGLIAKEDLLEPVDDEEVETRQWHAVRNLLRGKGLDVVDDFGSASDFVYEALRALSPQGFPLEPGRFLKAFRNALLLKPVDNPTEFVRNYVLDVPTIQIDRLRKSITLYRFLTGRIESIKAEAASLVPIQRVVARTEENEKAIRVADWQGARLRWEAFHREARKAQKELREFTAKANAKKIAAVAAATKFSSIDVDYTRIGLTISSSEPELLATMYESDRGNVVLQREAAFAPIKLLEKLTASIGTLTERRIIAGRDDILHGLLSSVVLAHKPAGLLGWAREMPDGWEKAALELDAAFAAVMSERLAEMQKVAADSLFAAQKEGSEIQAQIDQIDRNLERLDKGLSAIEKGTSALMEALQNEGIPAEPLCDIVEVKDQKWRLAAEAVLGWSREALIVESNLAVRALEVFRRGNEEKFRHAEVINTTKTDQTRAADKGSLATIIKTENRHARAFLDYRIGRLMMVETMDKLLAAENAITPDRMMQGGRTAKRLSHPGYLKLGRGTTEETRRLLQDERAGLFAALIEKARTAQRLKEDSVLIDEVVRGFEEMRAQNIACHDVGQALQAFDLKIAELNENITQARRNRDPKLLKEQERLKTALALAQHDKKTAEEESQKAHDAVVGATSSYDRLIKSDYERLRTERRMRARSLSRHRLSAGHIFEFDRLARQMTTISLASEVSIREADSERRSSALRQSLQRELTAKLAKHCEEFKVKPPFTAEDATMEQISEWTESEKARLETHELVKYEEQSRNAAGEMTTAFRDDLLHRLHDAFEGIKETLVELNRHLKDRVFHGRDFYEFKPIKAPTHADMIELILESRRPDFQLPLFEKTAEEEPDTPILRAVRRIEQILADPAAKTDEIEDPRKYFNFELYIKDEAGRIRSSLSSRAATGSGGEGQLPFYIAIAASLAATYQNRRTGQMGLALAIFDEAFNRLDSKAICACSDFIRSLGLQIVLATPDEKRHVFMEVADTIVNVNRSGNEVLVHTEYLTEKTRTSLSEIDPYRKGFDAFKAKMIAASATSAEQPIERGEAAE